MNYCRHSCRDWLGLTRLMLWCYVFPKRFFEAPNVALGSWERSSCATRCALSPCSGAIFSSLENIGNASRFSVSSSRFGEASYIFRCAFKQAMHTFVRLTQSSWMVSRPISSWFLSTLSFQMSGYAWAEVIVASLSHHNNQRCKSMWHFLGANHGSFLRVHSPKWWTRQLRRVSLHRRVLRSEREAARKPRRRRLRQRPATTAGSPGSALAWHAWQAMRSWLRWARPTSFESQRPQRGSPIATCNFYAAAYNHID